MEEDKSFIAQQLPRPRWQRILPFFISLAAVWVLVILASVKLYFHSGAFWRDELSSILLAQLPTIADMYANLEQDSAPLLFAFLIKAWITLGLGNSHSSLSLLGFFIYCGIGGALCWTSRSLGVRLPVLGSVFLLANGIVFYWGTSIRSYGMAALLAAILVGCVWRFITKGSRKWWLVTAVISVLCAQSNYQNTYIIFSVCTAGAVVSSVRRQWGRSVAILIIGVCAAVSLLPYYPVFVGASVWKILLTSTFDPLALFFGSIYILGSGQMWLGALWIIFPIYLVSTAFRRGWRAWRLMSLGTQTGRVLYAGITILLLAISMPLFVWKVGRGMSPWYYLPSIAVLACFLDLSLLRIYRSRLAIWGTAVMIGLLLLMQATGLLSYSNIRRTNLDLLATKVGEQATPGDFIIVSPIWVGHAFKFYYRGVAAWTVIPGLAPQDINRMDGNSFLNLTYHPHDVILPLISNIEKTLRSGHTVWVIGNVNIPKDGRLPTPPTSLRIMDCLDYWFSVLGLFLYQHADTGGTAMQIDTSGPVMYLEHLKMRKFTGWKE